MSRLAAMLVAGLAAVTWCPRVSDACSPAPCQEGYFVPGSGATVPANIPGLYWRPLGSYSLGTPTNDPALVTLATASDPTAPLAFTATPAGSRDQLLVPAQPLIDGTSYVLTDENKCNYPIPAPTSMFHVGPAATMPTVLGTLTATPSEVITFEVWTVSGTCTAPVDAVRATVTLALASEALPWRDALHFETLVDGLPWLYGDTTGDSRPPGSNGQGRGLDLVFHVCHTDDPGTIMGLDAGPHLVAMRATLPGSDLMLTTPTISVQLDCPPQAVGADMTDVPPVRVSGCGCAASEPRSLGLLVLALIVSTRRRMGACRRAR